MATTTIKNSVGGTVTVELPLTPGRVAATGSRPVVLSNEDLAALTAVKTAVDAVTTKLTGDPATGADIDAVVAAVNAIPAGGDASEATLALILAKLITSPATEDTLADVLAALNGNLTIDPTSLEDPYSESVWLPANTITSLGAAGAIGDYLAGIEFTPLAADCGQVTLKDGTAGTEEVIFAGGGTIALPSLHPFGWRLGAAATGAGGWIVNMGVGIKGVAVGKFT